ncbi:MAG: RNA polymerase sigma factor [Phycisphaerae bacterium]
MARVASTALPLELRAVVAGLTSADVADDQQWILSLMRKHGLAIITLLWRMLGSEQDVLDAYQTAICRLTARGCDGMGANPSGYFYRAVSNAGIETLRARQRHRACWPTVVEVQRRRSEDRSQPMGLDQREMIDKMRQAICQLPTHLRNVIVLRELAELPYSQVARILGIRNGTARPYRREAILRLADMVGREANP